MTEDSEEFEQKAGVIASIAESLTDNVITILVFSTLCFMWAMEIAVPTELTGLGLMIAGFYYGQK